MSSPPQVAEQLCRLDGRVALVTGGGRGIGAACARLLASAGATVVVNYLTSQQEAQELVAEIEQAGGKALSLGFDVTDSRAVTAAFEQIAGREGRLDVLVNNAGRRVDNLAVRMSDAQWREALAVNLDGVFYCSRTALALMGKNGGSIVNIASVAAYCGNPGQGNYAAAKAGVLGLTWSLALEYGGRGIRVNCVVPGIINTAMTEKLNPAYREQWLSRIPLRRFGEPEEVASAVLFLASDAASYISGATLHINGGGYPA